MTATEVLNRTGTVGIIAGGGPLPEMVADAVVATGRDVFVIALEGFAGKAVRRFPHARLRISQAGDIVGSLRQAGVRDLILIGDVRRPKRFIRDSGFSNLWYTLRNFDVLRSGDAGLLERVVRLLERAGFTVIGAHEIVPSLVVREGPLGNIRPGRRAEKDIARGFEAALGLGALDIGQGVVVVRNRVLAAEAAEGTDRMLARAAELKRDYAAEHGPQPPKGVLVKCPQPIQDLRVDMPTIGPTTIEGAIAARLEGVAIAAGRVLVYRPEEVRRLADEAGLFVVARPVPQSAGPRPE